MTPNAKAPAPGESVMLTSLYFLRAYFKGVKCPRNSSAYSLSLQIPTSPGVRVLTAPS